jgi:hypothetical protein
VVEEDSVTFSYPIRNEVPGKRHVGLYTGARGAITLGGRLLEHWGKVKTISISEEQDSRSELLRELPLP